MHPQYVVYNKKKTKTNDHAKTSKITTGKKMKERKNKTQTTGKK